jgi:tetratricopeptide (TPR) repeat protein
MQMKNVIPLTLFSALLLASGCSSDPLDDMTVARDEIPHEIAVLLDAGNAAFSSGDYETAREHYQGAATRDSTVAAAWYGVAMTERALGNDEAADAALARIGEIGATAAPHHAPGDSADAPRLSPHGSPHGAPPPARDSAQL